MANAVNKKFSKDMTVGVPTTLILSFMLPMMMGNIFQQFYNIVDTIIAGRFIDAKALAAVGSTGSTTNLFFVSMNAMPFFLKFNSHKSELIQYLSLSDSFHLTLMP